MSYQVHTELLSLRQLYDEKMQQVNLRAGAIPKKWRLLYQTGIGSKSAYLLPYYTDVNLLPGSTNSGYTSGTKGSMRGGLIITDVIFLAAPATFNASNYLQIDEDTALNQFTSGSTTVFKAFAAAAAYNAASTFAGLSLEPLNIYADRFAKFTVSNGVASTTVGVLVGYVDENITLSAAIPGAAISNTWDA